VYGTCRLVQRINYAYYTLLAKKLERTVYVRANTRLMDKISDYKKGKCLLDGDGSSHVTVISPETDSKPTFSLTDSCC